MDKNKLSEIWEILKIELENDFSNTFLYKNHFLNSKFFKCVDKTCYIIVYNLFLKEVLTKDYKQLIDYKFSNKLNLSVNTVFLLEDETNIIENNNIIQPIEFDETDLNHKFDFNNYVVGEFNKQLYDAAFSLAINNINISPLFIYGSTGLGKTHILNAIGNKFLENNRDKKVKYISTEDFLRQAYSCISHGGMKIEEYKNTFNDVDLLLIDDIQFLTNKDKLNEIFFSIFNYLIKKNRIIVISSDKVPDELKIDQRMISRFNSGLSIKIPKPDINTIKQIIISKVENSFRKNKFSSGAINFISNRFNTDIRVIEGIINKILFYSINNMSNDEIINEEKVKEILNLELENGLINNNYHINPKIIIDTVSATYGVNSDYVISKQRNKNYTFPRKVSMYILREKLKMSYSEIGKHFSNRDHSTVMDSVSYIANLIKTDKELKNFIETIIKKI